MNERDREVLNELRAHRDTFIGDGWARPMDVGGRNGDDTTSVLRRLVHAGYVETRQRGALLAGPDRGAATGPGAWEKTKARLRGSRVYRITKAGRAQLDATKR